MIERILHEPFVAANRKMSGQRFLTIAGRCADVVLATAGIVCLLVFANFFYLYHLTGTRHFASSLGPYLYYVAPMSLGILCLGALRLSPSRKVNLAFCLCSAGACIYSAETVITLWSNLPSVMESRGLQLRVETAKGLGIKFDTRSKTEVIDDLRRRGMDAVPAVYPQTVLKKQNDGTMKSVISINGTEVLPLAGIANKLTVVCNEDGQYLTYRSDEHGFHNPNGLWDNHGTDIVAVGDSFVQGFCVAPDKNVVALIRQRHPATLNLGIGGDGPLTMLAILREYARTLRPKVVLWFYFEGNDLGELDTERDSSLLRGYLTQGFSQNLFARQAEIDRALTEYVESVKDESNVSRKLREISELVRDFSRLPMALEGIIKLSTLRNRLGLVLGSEAGSLPQIESPKSESRARAMGDLANLLRQILLEANKSVSEWGGKLYLVYLPSWDRYAPNGNGPNPDRDLVLQVAASIELPLIDIHQAFMMQSDRLALFPLRLGHHYNEEGNRLVAEAVLRSVPVPR